MTRFNLSRWAIEHPALLTFLMALLLLGGAFQFIGLGRAEDPSFTLKTMIVSAQWPGASPAQMQAQVADPLERTLRSTESLDHLDTYCVEGACITQVVLKDGAPKARIPVIWQQVRHKLNDIAPSMPQGSALAADDSYSDVYGYVFVLTGSENARLVQAAERIRDDMLRIKDIGKVQIGGGLPRRIYVEFDPRRLAGMGISSGQLARALSARSIIAPSGASELGYSVPVRVGGAADGVASVEDTAVSTSTGSIRVRDIATASRDYADPAPALVRYNGEPAVVLSVAMTPGGDGLVFGDALRAAAARAGQMLPAGIHLVQVEDQSSHVREAVNTFLVKFFFALAVVLLVAFVTLGVRAGVIVALSVPLTLAIVAMFMGASGIGLERISLGALILSLGLLVDDAIISVEAMVMQLERGATRAAAAAYSWSHTAFPMLSGTLLTVISFLPVGLAQSTTGEYAGGIFWVTGAALLFSWIVAVLFVPFLGVRLLPNRPVHAERHEPQDGPVLRRLRAALEWSLTRRRTIAIATVLLVLLSGGAMTLVHQQFFPLSDRRELVVDVTMPPGSAIARTSDAVRQLEKQLVGDPDISHVESHIGDGIPHFYLPYSPALPNPANATLLVVTKDLEARERLIERIPALRIPADAKVHAQRLSLGPSTGFPVEYRVAGPDPDKVRDLARRLEDVLRQTPGTTAVQSNWGNRIPALSAIGDPMRMAKLGADRATLSTDIHTLLSGQPAGDVLDGAKRVGVVVRADKADRDDPGRLAELPVSTASGFVQLGQVARVAVTSEYPIIWRRDGAPCITVRADVKTGVEPAQIVASTAGRVAELRRSLPAGYRIELGGDEELSSTANDAIYALLPITLGAMLLVLMVQTQSFGRTLLVLATAPLGLIGAVVALLVTGKPFGFVALLGLIALSGMIMRNTIILVDQVQHNQAEGMALREAIVEATVERARPVVLTALAAVLAFIPLSFNVFWGPMAIVMIGGLVGATLLTLLALPALYALAFDRAPRTIQDPAHD